MLLYFISRNSKPQNDNEKSSRESLYKDIEANKHRDPISYSIIFPSDKDGKGIYKQVIWKYLWIITLILNKKKR